MKLQTENELFKVLEQEHVDVITNKEETKPSLPEFPKQKKFRLNAKKLFLTYPTLNLIKTIENGEEKRKTIEFSKETRENIKENVLEQIQKKLKHIEYYLIAEEMHADNIHFHLHCFVQLRTNFQTIDPRFFDIVLEGYHRHGEYYRGKYKNGIINYLIKDNNYITNMLLPVVNGKLVKPTTHLMQICKEENFQIAKDTLFEHYPDIASSRGTTVLKNLEVYNNYLFGKTIEERKFDRVFQLEYFDKLPSKTLDECLEWMEIGLEQGFTISLVLYGPPGTGKTLFAKAIYNHFKINYLEISNIQDFKYLDLNIHNGLLIDDLDFADKRMTRGIKLALTESRGGKTVEYKYGAAVTGAYTPRIFTVNDLEAFVKRLPEIDRRKKAVYIPYELSSNFDPNGVYIQNVNVNLEQKNYFFGDSMGISREEAEKAFESAKKIRERQKNCFDIIKKPKEGGVEVFEGQNNFIKELSKLK